MLVALDWLEEWIDLPMEIPALAERFTMAGLEVDAIERLGPDLSEITVGVVASCERHPNADRLSVCEVDIGGSDPVTVVCGAPNVAAGQKVAVAQPGTVLPDGTRLKKSKIRGVASVGMICSERELGLSEEHEGILVLDPDAVVGEALDQVVSEGTSVLEIAVLPNRGDCTSMLGIAREVRAYVGGEIRVPETAVAEAGGRAADDVSVVIDAPDACYRYEARVVRGLTVGPSPEWLQRRLTSAGVRPVNSVVDAGNLAMLEFGQPVHVFDLAHVKGGAIRVRTASPGETIETLDGESRELEGADLVIADEDHAIAIAGVMGGRDSEVTQQTTEVVIESAHFDPEWIRRTGRRLGIASDAAYRFERGVDSQGVRRAADRVAHLLVRIAGGTPAPGVVCCDGAEFPASPAIELDPKSVNHVLGTNLSADEQGQALERLGLRVESGGGEALVCQVPSHRNDLGIPEDLVEEIARIVGLDTIPAMEAQRGGGGATRPTTWQISQDARDVLAAQGFMEVLCFPFMNPAELDSLRLPDADPRRETVEVKNPVVDSESQLRSTLVPSLLQLARANFNRQADAVSLFELARVFHAKGGSELPEERLRVCVLLTASSEPQLWASGDAPLFFVAKGVTARFAAALGFVAEFSGGETEPFLHPGASCAVATGEVPLGSVGELHPSVASAFEIPVPAALIDLDLSALAPAPGLRPQYQEVSRQPQAKRDLAVILDRDQAADEVVEAIRKQGGPHLIEVSVFDRYEGRGVASGRVSIAFRLVFQRADRTLTDAEVSKATDKIVRMLDHRFQGELR